MGQFKPMVKMMTTEPTVELKLKKGGKVVGKVRHPFPGTDFSSFLLQAQSSKAKVIGLANAGQDTINSIKQAGEFGIVKGGQKLAGLLVFATDVQSLTLPVAQGLVLTESFYWDMNDETRAWTKRYRAKKDRLPSMLTAGVLAGSTCNVHACRRQVKSAAPSSGPRPSPCCTDTHGIDARCAAACAASRMAAAVSTSP